MPAYKKYLPYLGLILVVALAGCGSSGGDSQTLPDPDPAPASSILEIYNEGAHAEALLSREACFACHATEGNGLLNVDATYQGGEVTQSQQYNTCITCHYDIHADYNFDKAAPNSCTQCHDPHAATKFNQNTVATIVDQWNESGHADHNSQAFNHDFDADCLTCHSGSVFAQTISSIPEDEIDRSAGANIVACGACHDLLARNDEGAFALGSVRQIDSVTFPSGAEINVDFSNNLCLTCHQGRSSTPTVNERIAEGNLNFSNIHYAPAAATQFGNQTQGGYEYPGRLYRGHNTFAFHASTYFNVPELTTCTGCHMDAGSADHSFTVDITNCTDCHAGNSFTTLSGSPKMNYDNITGLKAQLKTLLEASGVTFEPYFSGITTENQLKAAYNWQLANMDKGGHIHNGNYLRQLLYDSIVDMGDVPVSTRPVTN